MSIPKHVCLLVIALTLATGPVCPAREADTSFLEPKLGELDPVFKFQLPVASSLQAAQPDWVRTPDKELAAFALKDKVRTLPGLQTYDTSVPPMSTRWWNYPIYAVLGCPRDLIDGLFGTLGNAPFYFNIISTGAMYELVPSQILFRDYRDWHKWPGRINANGHGWLDGTWGWFSNFHNTTFKQVDEKELARREAYNHAVTKKLADANEQVASDNTEIRARRAAYLKETRAIFDAGKHRTVIQRMVAYRKVDPLSNSARALLVASLIADMGEIPERAWVDSTLSDMIWGSSRNVLTPVRDELKTMLAAHPSENLARYLVAVNMRLENLGQAMEAAKELVAMNPTDVTDRRLEFEVALAGRDSDTIEAAAKEIERLAGEKSAVALHARGRQALLSEDPQKAAQIYARAIAVEPLNPRFHYLKAMSAIEIARLTGKYDRAGACRSLENAIKYSRGSDEKLLYQRTLEAAKTFKPKKPSETPDETTESEPKTKSSPSLFGEGIGF